MRRSILTLACPPRSLPIIKTGLFRFSNRSFIANDGRGDSIALALKILNISSGSVGRHEMTAEQIIKEIEALPKPERKRLVKYMRQLRSNEIPQDFIDALEEFEKGRFVSMETALNEVPPDA